MRQVILTALPQFPLVQSGDDLGTMIVSAMERAGLRPEPGDVLVVAQKIVSKAEDRYAYLNGVAVSAEAEALAAEVDKDPHLVQLILSESVEVVRKRRGVLIVRHRKGYVHANAGIDQSNIDSDPENPRVLLLPTDPDRSARALRRALRESFGCEMAVIINDSAGRAWRNGTVGMAIGSAGFEPVENLVGKADLYQRRLQTSEVAVADELAAAASLVMGQAAEASPVVLIRGVALSPVETGSQGLIRESALDLFR
ncbi:coenzyme F420-0:L-glutamate ligase [Pseudohaliea sp.]|uniref:coenzyme F420-0:L-glutamate ligase n=1 Tax=Pseudohaliea sp. TaxID=2740289 RepID=UPI0032F0604C